MVVGCSHSAISMRIGLSASTWWRIWAMVRNRRMAVEFSIASAAKLVRRGFACSISSFIRAKAAWLARSSLPSGSIRRRMAFCSWLELTRKCTQPMPSPSARIAAATVSRRCATSSSALVAKASIWAMIGLRLTSLSGCSAVSVLAAAESAAGSVSASANSAAMSPARSDAASRRVARSAATSASPSA